MASTIRFYLSGGKMNADPAKSLGGPISQTEVTELFSDIDPDLAATGSVELRCVYLLVAEGGPVEHPRVWFTDVPERTVMEIAAAESGIFVRPDDYLTGLDLGGPYNEGDSVALWIRRSIPSGAKSGRESFNLRVRGLTATRDVIP